MNAIRSANETARERERNRERDRVSEREREGERESKRKNIHAWRLRGTRGAAKGGAGDGGREHISGEGEEEGGVGERKVVDSEELAEVLEDWWRERERGGREGEWLVESVEDVCIHLWQHRILSASMLHTVIFFLVIYPWKMCVFESVEDVCIHSWKKHRRMLSASTHGKCIFGAIRG